MEAAQALWNLYCPGLEFDTMSPTHLVTDKLADFFDRDGRHLIGNLAEIAESHVLQLRFAELVQACSIPGVDAAIRDRPEDTLRCMAFAIHRLLLAAGETSCVERTVNVRLLHYPATRLKHLKANQIGRFFAVKGTVVRITTVRPFITDMGFVCGKCGAVQRQYFADGQFESPTRCATSGCRSRTFVPDRNDCRTIDWQKLRLQEIVEDSHKEAGRIPRTIDCELTDDLIDCCIPGDIVTISGIVKRLGGESGQSGPAQNKALFHLYLHANSMVSLKATEGPGKTAAHFSDLDMQFIREVAYDTNTFRLLVQSLCPTIYGQEMVKAGLVLCLFGGVSKYVTDCDKLAVRGDPHMLIVGDPGLGKSQMLRAASSLAPRGVYVCGNTTSVAGLTVTLGRDPQTGELALDAGALVLADQGVCAIDEFDKMGAEHCALLEAMEQQTISIAKAGMVCSLSARCSVISAANPVGGHYDRAKTVCENLKMSAVRLLRGFSVPRAPS
jgi:DNA helicase MCM8